MFPATTLRGRNIEDIGELEEKGLLRASSRDSSEDGMRRRGKEKEVRVEKMVDGEGHEAVGLNNPRDRQAFALLVVLCEFARPPLCAFIADVIHRSVSSLRGLERA